MVLAESISTSDTSRQRELITRVRAVRDGAELGPELAVMLLSCDGHVQEELLAAAMALKEKYHPGVVTY